MQSHLTQSLSSLVLPLSSPILQHLYSPLPLSSPVLALLYPVSSHLTLFCLFQALSCFFSTLTSVHPLLSFQPCLVSSLPRLTSAHPLLSVFPALSCLFSNLSHITLPSSVCLSNPVLSLLYLVSHHLTLFCLSLKPCPLFSTSSHISSLSSVCLSSPVLSRLYLTSAHHTLFCLFPTASCPLLCLTLFSLSFQSFQLRPIPSLPHLP